MMMETADLYEIPLESVETKAALLAVSRYLDRLWIADTVDDCEKLLNLCLNEILFGDSIKNDLEENIHENLKVASENGHSKWASSQRH